MTPQNLPSVKLPWAFILALLVVPLERLWAFECAPEGQTLEVGWPLSTVNQDPNRSLAAGHFDGDAQVDLVMPATQSLFWSSLATMGLTVRLASDLGSGGTGNMFFPVKTFDDNGGLRLPTGLAVLDVNGDGKSDLIHTLSGFGRPSATVLQTHRTDLAPADFSGPPDRRRVKMFTDPEPIGRDLADHGFDLPRVFATLPTTVLPAAARDLITKLMAVSKLSTYQCSGTSGKTWRFHFTTLDGSAFHWRFEVDFTKSWNATYDPVADAWTSEDLWAATRCTIYAPHVKLLEATETSQVVAGRLPGNTLPDLIVNSAWYELQLRPGTTLPWDYIAVKKQDLPETTLSGRDDSVLIQIGTAWHLFSVDGARRLQRRAFTGGSFAAPVPVSPEGLQVEEFTLGDVDRDNVLDLVFATGFNAPHNKLYFAKGLGNGTFADPVVVMPLLGACQDVKIMDLDQDGRRDILLSDFLPPVLPYDVDAKLVWVRSLTGNTFASPLYFPHTFHFLDELLPTTHGQSAERLAVLTRAAIVTRPDGFGTTSVSSEVRLVSYDPVDRAPVGEQWEVAGRGLGSMAVAPDGRIGMLVAESNSKWQPAPLGDERERLLFVERSATGVQSAPEQIVCFGPQGYLNFEQVALFYNADGNPEVYVTVWGQITRMVRIDGIWSEQETVSVPEGLFPGQGISFYKNSVAVRGSDGSTHFALYASGGGNVRLLHARRSVAGDWTWSVAATAAGNLSNLDSFEWVEVRHNLDPRNLSLAVDRNGKAHIAYSWNRQITPIAGGSNVRSSLFYATNAGGAWTSETLLSPGSGFGDAGLGASVAAAPDGSVAVAASWIPRVPTGSPGSAQLRYFVKPPGGAWQASVVATSADGYEAGDGPRGTGLFPRLVFDQFSSPHLVFTDHASQHFPGFGAKSFSGQVRYATRSAAASGTWILRTLARRGAAAALNFQTYDVDLVVGEGRVLVAATNYVWNGSRRAYLKQHFVNVPPPVDSDGDGLPDGLELARGTDPAQADTDGDGIPDLLDTQPLEASPLFFSVGGGFAGVGMAVDPTLGVITGITGLPPGLRYDAAGRRIVGTLGAVGTVVKSYTATLSLRRPDGVVFRVPLRLTVEPLPAWATGNHVALLAGGEGSLQLTATPAGTFTGQLRLANAVLPLRGQLVDPRSQAARGGVEQMEAVATFLPVPANKARIGSVRVFFAPDTFHGTVDLAPGTVALEGWKQVWAARINPAWGGVKRGPVHAVLTNTTAGTGEGFAVLNLTDAGVVSWSGRLPDGTTVTGSSPLSPDREALLYTGLRYPGHGALGALLPLTEVSGRVRVAPAAAGWWWKKVDPAGRERLEPGAFRRTLTFAGGEFVAPAPGVLLVPGTVLTFGLQGASLATAAQLVPGHGTFQLGQKANGQLTSAPTNAVAVRATLTGRTGAFTASLTLSDPVPGVTRPVVRTVNAAGLFIPGETPGTGAVRGFCTLPDLPSAGQAAATTPIRSGSIRLEP